jgi:hypothetical protein
MADWSRITFVGLMKFLPVLNFAPYIPVRVDDVFFFSTILWRRFPVDLTIMSSWAWAKNLDVGMKNQ